MKWKISVETPDEKTFQSDFSDKMAMRILRQKMDIQLIALTNSNKINGKISNSQISRLRLHLREILRKPNLKQETTKQEIEKFFTQLKPTALNQIQSVKVKNLKLDDWVKNEVENLNQLTKRKITLGGKTYGNEELMVEYHLHLIDGVLAQAAKEVNK